MQEQEQQYRVVYRLASGMNGICFVRAYNAEHARELVQALHKGMTILKVDVEPKHNALLPEEES